MLKQESTQSESKSDKEWDYNMSSWQADTDPNRRIRQAVVVIHGIGEQRPMDTLRSFVDAVLANRPDHKIKYRSKPDAMNNSLETRCLQAPSDRGDYLPLTDFYEYYWAHHMEGSKYAHVLNWLITLLLRRPKVIPDALKSVYYISWGLILFAVILIGSGFVSASTGSTSFFEELKHQKLLFSSGLLTLITQWIGSYFILGYVADAARYLSPTPENIEARNKIRSEGIKLLSNLHASGKYNRIVIVGHSLGSVIGYDIIRNLWLDLRKPSIPYPQKQNELKQFKNNVTKLETSQGMPVDIEAFQQCQHRLWQEFRLVGIPWLVTDFITLGSPLAHAEILMADNPSDLKRKHDEYEYPCCPPSMEDQMYYHQHYQFTKGPERGMRSVFIPHHGAPFSCTRWTNLYFPYHNIIFGDLIGGPLNHVFGKGIRDVPLIASTKNYLDSTLISHTRYWNNGDKTDKNSSIEKLRNALRLDFLRGKSSKIKPGFVNETISN